MADPFAVVSWARSGRSDWLLKDLFTFAKYGGICPDIDEPTYKPICDHLESYIPSTKALLEWKLRTGRIRTVPDVLPKKRGIFAMPRLTWKTSLIKALSLYVYLLDPSVTMMLGRATTGMSEETLRAIKTHIEQNALLNETFGDLRDQFISWTTEEIVSAKRPPGISEPTMGTTGLNTSKTGAHLDFVILDDLAHELNYESVDQMETARRVIAGYVAIIKGGASILLVGTRWGDNDPIGWIMEEDDKGVEKELAAGRAAVPIWERFIRGAYNDDGSIAFPVSLPEKRIEEYRRDPTISSKMFSAWILNKTRSDEEDIFPYSHLQYFDGEFMGGIFPHLELAVECDDLIRRFGRRVPMTTVQLIDPALTVGKRADFTGHVIVGFDMEANWWVFVGEEIKRPPDERLDYLIENAIQFRPMLTAIENGDMAVPQFERTLRAKGLDTKVVAFDPRMDRRKITASPELAPRGRTKKEAQIERIQHPYKARRIFFHRYRTSALVRQVTKYPYIDHDDVIDAMSMGQAYEREMVLAAQDLTAAKVDTDLEAREYALEGLAFDGTDLDAEPALPGPAKMTAGVGTTVRPGHRLPPRPPAW